MKKIYIIGMGNLLMGDDGFGIRIIEELAMKSLPQEVVLIEDQWNGITMPSADEKNSGYIFVDAVKSGLPPGSVSRYRYSDITINKSQPVSLDQLSGIDLINFSNEYIDPSNITIIGIEPKSIMNGTGLSPEVESKIPDAIALVINEIEKYLNVQK